MIQCASTAKWFNVPPKGVGEIHVSSSRGAGLKAVTSHGLCRYRQVEIPGFLPLIFLSQMWNYSYILQFGMFDRVLRD